MVFRVNACIQCGTATIHTCCNRCVQKCIHSWVEVHTTPGLAMAIRCQKCFHTATVQLKEAFEEALARPGVQRILEEQRESK